MDVKIVQKQDGMGTSITTLRFLLTKFVSILVLLHGLKVSPSQSFFLLPKFIILGYIVKHGFAFIRRQLFFVTKL